MNFCKIWLSPRTTHRPRKNMDGNLVRQLCDLLEIRKTRTTPYHPSSNGQVERYNRVILQMLRCYLKGRQHTWDIHLQQFAGAIRSNQNRQTGFSPNFMMLGREVTHPVEIMLGNSALNNPEKDQVDFISDLTNNMSKCHEIARENIGLAQCRQKKDYDMNINQKQYNVGDIVLKIDSATKLGQSSKLKSPWKGPYLVTAIKLN